MSFLFGGSKQKSQSTESSQAQSTQNSGNQAYPMIQQQYSAPAADAYQSGISLSKSLLGGGFDDYLSKTGYDFENEQGTSKLANQYAGRGVFGSGAFGQALQKFGSGLKQTYADSYLGKLLALAQQGTAGGQLVSGAGQYSNGQSTSTSTGQSTGSTSSNNGAAATIGSLASLVAASDARLKMNIEKIGEDRGLGIYRYDYVNGKGPYIGVMAHEVKEKYPEALGPEVAGYMTVDYGKLKEVTQNVL